MIKVVSSLEILVGGGWEKVGVKAKGIVCLTGIIPFELRGRIIVGAGGGRVVAACRLTETCRLI